MMKRWIALLLFIATLLTCSACKRADGNDPDGGQTNAGDVIEIPDLQGYRIVRPAQADRETAEVVSLLQKTIKEKTGAELPIVRDTSVETDADAAAKEILIGNTNRPESERVTNLKCYDYAVKYEQEKLVIKGGSAEALLGAVNCFATYLSANGVALPRAGVLYAESYLYEQITIGGVDISRFSLSVEDEEAAKRLQAFFGKAVGIKLPIAKAVAGSSGITLEKSSKLINGCEIKVENGNLVLLCDWAICDEFVQYFTETYFDAFTERTLSLTSQNNQRLSAKELTAAVESDALRSGISMDPARQFTINCFGDSVTEGASVDGAGQSTYGKEPYPAQLATYLTDEGYNIVVRNYGYGGENLAETAVRSGALTCYTTEDILLPDDGSFVSLGARIRENGKISGTKLYIPKGQYTEVDRYVYFTNTVGDTNPIDLDGVTCQMIIGRDIDNLIKKKYSNGSDTLIPAGTPLYPGNKTDGDLNIFCAGINDQANMSLNDYIGMLSKCGKTNGGDYIVLGCTREIWQNWSDLKGYSKEQKTEMYRQACYDAFGYRFIDLYEEFSVRGLDIALECGFFADKTDAELDALRQKLENHIIPGEFTISGNDNDVHLSKAGYAVVVQLILERMELLSYI